MKKLFKTLVAIAFVAMIAACKTSSGSIAQQQPEGITEKYWKLIEINGNRVATGETTGGREAFLFLRNEDNRFNANGGCNTLTGTYEIEPATNRIQFSQVATTTMACLDMEVEESLKRALGMTDNYSVSEDGKYLSLNRARMAPLARFEVMYLR